MSSTTLYRMSGLALLLGAVLGSIGQILGSILFSSDGSLLKVNYFPHPHCLMEESYRTSEDAS